MVITRAHLGSQIALLLDNPINTTETKAKCQVCIKWAGIVTDFSISFFMGSEETERDRWLCDTRHW